MESINKLALGIFVSSSLLYFFSYPGVDNDLWGHLYFGKEILQAGELPLKNIYSYTAPDHPWINHEWLAEVIFYGTYSLLGSPGLILLKVVVGGGIVWMLNGIIGKGAHPPLVRILTLIWTMALLAPGFNVRPQIFTYLLFAAFLSLFFHAQKKGTAPLYGIPFLTLLWVNLHGGFVAGLGALCLFVLMNLMPAASKKGGSALRNKSLAIVMGLTLIALLINPYGWTLLKFLWNDLLLDRPITEWKSIPLWGLSFIGFKLALLVVLFSLRRNSWLQWEWVLTLLTAFLAFRHQRHTPLFAIAAAPLMAHGLERILHWMEGLHKEGRAVAQRPATRWTLTVGILILAGLQWLWLGKAHIESRFQLVVSPLEYPTQAADFMVRNGIQGNMAVPFDWGEYLIWKLYPGSRVSIDGRYTTAYPDEVIEDTWEWMKGGRGWKRLLEHYPTEIAVTYRGHPVSPLLRRDGKWVYIYSDPVSFIFIKKTPSQSALLEKFKAKQLLRPRTPSTYFPG